MFTKNKHKCLKRRKKTKSKESGGEMFCELLLPCVDDVSDEKSC